VNLFEVLGGVLKKITRVSEDEVEEEWKGIASLQNKRSSLMACKRGLLALEELVDAARRQIRIGVVEKRRYDVLREDHRRWWGPRELRNLQGTLSVKGK
jgi:hypothetical protein